MRTKNFWLITMGHACSSIVIVTITVHLGPMLDDRGFSLETIGLIVGAYTGIPMNVLLLAVPPPPRAARRVKAAADAGTTANKAPAVHPDLVKG